MATAGQTITHPTTGEQITFVRTAADTDGAALEMAFVVAPGGAPAAPHVHPRQRERFVVHAGRARVRVGDEERLLGPGDEAEVPAGITHTWSAAGPDDLEMHVTLEPAMSSEGFFEDFFALAEAGLVNEAGMPSLPRVAKLLTDHPDTMYLAKPPVPVQKALCALLAPWGRRLAPAAR